MASIKEQIENLKNGDTLIVESGRYFIDETIEIVNKKNITIKSDGDVFFDGGIVIPNDKIKSYKNSIKVVDLSGYNIELSEYGTRGFRRSYVNAPNELFINGRPFHVSIYPKDRSFTYSEADIKDCGSKPTEKEYDNRPGVLNISDEKVLSFVCEDDMYLAGFPCHSWADDCIKIARIDKEAKTLTTTEPHLFGFAATGHSSWHILNVFSELSEYGEYYIDKKNKKLYFICDEEIETVQLSVLGSVMVAIENSENVRIEGITFENGRNTGIYIEGGEGCIIDSCTFRNLGIMAVQMGQGATDQPNAFNTHHGERADWVEPPVPKSREMGSWHEYLYEFAAWDNNAGYNHSIQNCKIYNMGAGGVLLSGGNRKKLIPGNNRVYNCEIYEVNRLDKTYKAGVNIMGVGNTIAHCEIYDLTGMGIYLHGNDHLIEYNKIHDVLKSVSDSGAIYMGRDMSEVGNVFRYNFIYSIHNPHKTDLGVCAIYFDDWSIYNIVYANYFYDIVSDGRFFFSTVYHTCGGLTSIGNNILIDCFPGFNPNTKSNANLHMHEDKLSIVRVNTTDENDMHGVDITSTVYKEKYPYLYKTYTEDYNPGTKFWHNRVYVNQYNDFADAENLDFSFIENAEHLQSNMPEYKITDDAFGLCNETVEIKNIDFKNIGRL